MAHPPPYKLAPTLDTLAWQGILAGFSTAAPWPNDDALSQTMQGCLLNKTIYHRTTIPPPVAVLHQHHSIHLVEWKAEPHSHRPRDMFDAKGHAEQRGDGWVSAQAGIFLCIKTADCVPLLAFEPRLRQCAALHAGWRGVALGILPALVRRWQQQGGVISQMKLAIGPHILPCCFEVKEDCLSQFKSRWLLNNVRSKQGKTYLNLAGVLQTQLRELGGSQTQQQILQSQTRCTRCYQLPNGHFPYASHRRRLAMPKAARPVRMSNLSVIALQ